MTTDDARPFVIWTMQRCGSTTLARTLATLGDGAVRHEPFNPGRTFAGVAERFNRHGNHDRLVREVRDCLQDGQSLKICVEVIGWPLGRAIFRACRRLGFVHVVLTRGSVPRLLSYEFARRTRAWGPDKAAMIGPLADVFAQPLPAARLARREATGLHRLDRIRHRLTEAGLPLVEVRFETLFDADEKAARDDMARVLAALGLGAGEAALKRAVTLLRGAGEQKTRDHYADFRGVSRLEQALAEPARQRA